MVPCRMFSLDDLDELEVNSLQRNDPDLEHALGRLATVSIGAALVELRVLNCASKAKFVPGLMLQGGIDAIDCEANLIGHRQFPANTGHPSSPPYREWFVTHSLQLDIQMLA